MSEEKLEFDDEEQELPEITGEVPDNEVEAAPEHAYLVSEEGEPEDG